MDVCLDLGPVENAFAQGGNRLCFIDPADANVCIKVWRPDRTPKKRRSLQKFPKNLRPIDSFDENLEEKKVIEQIFFKSGREASAIVVSVFDMVATNYGPGLRTQLIRDHDNKISLTMKHYVWDIGFDEKMKDALTQFSDMWVGLEIPSRKLLLHNILVRQLTENKMELIAVDGLGDPAWLPISKFSHHYAKARAKKRVKQLQQAIFELLKKKEAGADFGIHGWLGNDKRMRT